MPLMLKRCFRGLATKGTSHPLDTGKKAEKGIDADALISNLFGHGKTSPARKSPFVKLKPAMKDPSSSPVNNFRVEEGSTIRGELMPHMLNIERICDILDSILFNGLDMDPPKDAKIPRLTNGLERVLFNPGVHVIRDLRTNVYNFDPEIQRITQPDEFNYDCLPPFIPPFKDTNLRNLAKQKGAKFISSTSSISSSLGMIYYVVSNMRQLNLCNLSSSFAEESKNFTIMTRSPTSVILRPHGNGIRSIVTEKIDSGHNVLSLLGQSLEKRLTMEKDDFKQLLKGSTQPNLQDDLDGYAHSLVGDILIRSQLDCYDPRLPRKSFDLKTRATLPIRMDVANYKSHLDYRLTSHHGMYGSYEREFYDMCRSALLKYNFQVRIGNMDGIFVAYHNTAEIFGFQYLSKEAMDECLFGNSVTGDAAFLMITKLYDELLGMISPQFKEEEAIRLTFTVNRTGSKLTIFAEAIPEPEAKTVVPNSAHVRQYTLSTYSTVNDVRSDDIMLHPLGSDVWKLYYTLAETKPDLGEFVSARAKATELIRMDLADPPKFNNESFFRGIHESIRNTRLSEKEEGREPVIASWTYPSNSAT